MTTLISLQDIIALAVLLAAGHIPWWLAGRAAIPARERLPVRELGWIGIYATLRRGASSPSWSRPNRDH